MAVEGIPLEIPPRSRDDRYQLSQVGDNDDEGYGSIEKPKIYKMVADDITYEIRPRRSWDRNQLFQMCDNDGWGESMESNENYEQFNPQAYVAVNSEGKVIGKKWYYILSKDYH